MRVSGFGDTQRKILIRVKERGGATVRELADSLGLNVETIRAHLKALRVEGVTERTGKRVRGRGRPETVYGLTADAERLFPRLEGRVLKGMTAYILEKGEADLVEGFLERFFSEHKEAALERVRTSAGPDRLEAVAAVLTEMGFMARVEKVDGTPRLQLSHCPLLELVEATDLPCRVEADFVSDLLADDVTRVRHQRTGDSSCVYMTMQGDWT